ncbi:hypothetical protein GCM10017786_05160 [Amycolatopsis deserti]|uniref:Uncharacterized protein n=1 Tax=Amycolatopsis deserti TaxID=185696 RepID=A0ABQ3IGZ2_9PSEU|nr:hypothetical protein GCM10017786_05160 [Amycolatopsis deserti]
MFGRFKRDRAPQTAGVPRWPLEAWRRKDLRADSPSYVAVCLTPAFPEEEERSALGRTSSTSVWTARPPPWSRECSASRRSRRGRWCGPWPARPPPDEGGRQAEVRGLEPPLAR